MKLAILGHSPLALEAALRFHLHGAALTWYLDADDFTQFESVNYPENYFTSELGLNVLKEIDSEYRPSFFSWDQWVNHYAKPLVNYLKAHQEVKDDEVVSVTKRFLAPGEKISGSSRFLDLFRVIYRVNPKDFIEKQKELNPETYHRLTEEFVQSLVSTIEMYQDFDLVLDLRSDLDRASIGITGRALGEGRRSEHVSYSLAALRKAKNILSGPDYRELAVVGSGALACEIVLSLSEWMKDPHSRLFIVSHEEDPFSLYFQNGHPQSVMKLKKILSDMEKEFEDEVKLFTQKLRDWQELDDFVQIKVPRPSEPIPRLNFFSGHNVTAIDELIDRKRMFLTLEKPDFRQGKKHSSNNTLDLKTIGVDHILVAYSKKDLSKIELDAEEKGFFQVTPTQLNMLSSWEKDLKSIEGIEDEIFKLFSPADSH